MTLALILFAICLIFFSVPAIAIIYHLLKFGIKKDLSRTMAIIFAIVSLALIALALFFLLIADWPAVFESFPFEFQGLS